jgi:hypothetical protein
MEVKQTARGFDYTNFADRYNEKCSLQKSSLAFEDCIWLGVDKPKPMILKKGSGWVEYPLPDEVELNGRMHLTRDMVRELLPHLQKFVETGDL